MAGKGWAQNGGAMAEEEIKEGSIGSDGSGERGPDPENGRVVLPLRFLKKAEETLDENIDEVFTCIMDNVKAGHLPSAKMLLDLVREARRGVNVPAAAFESLAEALWKSVNELKQETEDGELKTGE
jgi:hypothetical protein